jgi:hypothetical protein
VSTSPTWWSRRATATSISKRTQTPHSPTRSSRQSLLPKRIISAQPVRRS